MVNGLYGKRKKGSSASLSGSFVSSASSRPSDQYTTTTLAPPSFSSYASSSSTVSSVSSSMGNHRNTMGDSDADNEPYFHFSDDQQETLLQDARSNAAALVVDTLADFQKWKCITATNRMKLFELRPEAIHTVATMLPPPLSDTETENEATLRLKKHMYTLMGVTRVRAKLDDFMRIVASGKRTTFQNVMNCLYEDDVRLADVFASFGTLGPAGNGSSRTSDASVASFTSSGSSIGSSMSSSRSGAAGSSANSSLESSDEQYAVKYYSLKPPKEKKSTRSNVASKFRRGGGTLKGSAAYDNGSNGSDGSITVCVGEYSTIRRGKFRANKTSSSPQNLDDQRIGIISQHSMEDAEVTRFCKPIASTTAGSGFAVTTRTLMQFSGFVVYPVDDTSLEVLIKMSCYDPNGISSITKRAMTIALLGYQYLENALLVVRLKQSQYLSSSSWVRSGSRKSCNVCLNSFTISRRKHHCRLCGEVTCSKCSAVHQIRLGDKSTGKQPFRICAQCVNGIDMTQRSYRRGSGEDEQEDFTAMDRPTEESTHSGGESEFANSCGLGSTMQSDFTASKGLDSTMRSDVTSSTALDSTIRSDLSASKGLDSITTADLADSKRLDASMRSNHSGSEGLASSGVRNDFTSSKLIRTKSTNEFTSSKLIRTTSAQSLRSSKQSDMTRVSHASTATDIDVDRLSEIPTNSSVQHIEMDRLSEIPTTKELDTDDRFSDEEPNPRQITTTLSVDTTSTVVSSTASSPASPSAVVETDKFSYNDRFSEQSLMRFHDSEYDLSLKGMNIRGSEYEFDDSERGTETALRITELDICDYDFNEEDENGFEFHDSEVGINFDLSEVGELDDSEEEDEEEDIEVINTNSSRQTNVLVLDQVRDAQLAEYGIMDSNREHTFDLIVKQAAQKMNCALASISFVDSKREFIKASFGVQVLRDSDLNEIPKQHSLAAAMMQRAERSHEDTVVVLDARKDDTLCTNLFVCEAPYLRFVVGIPISNPDGVILGALMVADDEPRQELTTEQEELLNGLVAQVGALLEDRWARLAHERKAQRGAVGQMQETLQNLLSQSYNTGLQLKQNEKKLMQRRKHQQSRPQVTRYGIEL